VKGKKERKVGGGGRGGGGGGVQGRDTREKVIQMLFLEAAHSTKTKLVFAMINKNNKAKQN